MCLRQMSFFAKVLLNACFDDIVNSSEGAQYTVNAGDASIFHFDSSQTWLITRANNIGAFFKSSIINEPCQNEIHLRQKQYIST